MKASGNSISNPESYLRGSYTPRKAAPKRLDRTNYRRPTRRAEGMVPNILSMARDNTLTFQVLCRKNWSMAVSKPLKACVMTVSWVPSFGSRLCSHSRQLGAGVIVVMVVWATFFAAFSFRRPERLRLPRLLFATVLFSSCRPPE